MSKLTLKQLSKPSICAAGVLVTCVPSCLIPVHAACKRGEASTCIPSVWTCPARSTSFCPGARGLQAWGTQRGATCCFDLLFQPVVFTCCYNLLIQPVDFTCCFNLDLFSWCILVFSAIKLNLLFSPVVSTCCFNLLSVVSTCCFHLLSQPVVSTCCFHLLFDLGPFFVAYFGFHLLFDSYCGHTHVRVCLFKWLMNETLLKRVAQVFEPAPLALRPVHSPGKVAIQSTRPILVEKVPSIRLVL